MSTLKLQPRRRHLAAAITIALTSAFIAIAVLAVGFLGDAVRAQMTEPVAGASAVAQPAYSSDTNPAAFTPEALGKVEGADGAFYMSTGLVAIALDEGETGQENPLKSKGTFVQVNPVRPGAGADFIEGREPSAENEVAVDSTYAKKRDLTIGSTLAVQSLDTGETLEFTVSGINRPLLSQVLNPGGRLTFSNAGIDLIIGAGSDSEQQSFSMYPIAVVAKPGVSEEQLVANLESAGYDSAITVTKYLEETASISLVIMALLSTVLLAFVLIAIATSALVVTNSFAVTMAQRRRSFALARALGASRRQAMWAIVRDALLVGVVGALAGVVLAYLAWWGILLLGRATYTEALPLIPGFNILAVLVPLVSSLILAVCASVFPALGAMRVKPLEALRPAEVASGKHASLIRTIFSAAVVTFGIVLILGSFAVAIALDDNEYAPLISMLLAFVGSITVLLGVIGVLPALIPPFAKAGNAIASALGLTSARFALLNAARHPKRTGITMSALIIGTTLMATMAAGAVTAEKTLIREVTDRFPVDSIIAATDMPAGFLDKVKGTPGVGEAREVPAADLMIGGASEEMTTFAPTADDIKAVATSDQIELPQPGEIILGKDRAQKFKVSDGQVITITGEDGSSHELKVRVSGRLAISLINPDTLHGLGVREGKAVFAKFADPNSPERANTSIFDVIVSVGELSEQLPPDTVMMVKLEGAQREIMSTVIQTLLTITVVLLAVAVVVALVGVANTLSLSVIERSSEYALMRALGTSKGAIRAMLLWEGAFIASIGSLIGAVLGCLFGILGVRSLLVGDFAFYPAVPWLYLIVIVVAGLIAGILASILPGLRASAAAPAQALARRDE
ncbi:FtsX-like permease family protein [Dermabacter sp. HSID17554]|uniref:FtsX-like permease family protein n=1 Tax=Dermabacter sp. HSID17554 TaxID=2419511 RepID=UPI000F877716|nr:FtsX-like permease family protein [Dermabacter sp. HSID17554]RUP86021.1 FtsX-like permease family protein [Dermabacter sp. HSID17554]